MIRIEVRHGTDSRRPSCRVRIFDQPENAEGDTTREIALVFDPGVSHEEARKQISRAVLAYVEEHSERAGRGRAFLPAGILGPSFVEEG